ncbi:MAG: short-chain dehydrogenase [Rhodospirillaceae bacterium]|nr:short-chain dehydrogenase [Rhodospirillaceae bacterium]
MVTVLITGASRGLGAEFTRQFSMKNWQVIATCRDPDNAASSIGNTNVTLLPLDVTKEDSVAKLQSKLAGQPIDILINNAGIIGQRDGFGALDYDAWAKAMDTNLYGALRVSEALVENVLSSTRKQMIFITSRMGSISEASPNAYVYRSSKAALNMAVKCLALELTARQLTAVLFHPGHVQTDMGGVSAPVTPETSITGMISQIMKFTVADSGKFFSYDGSEIPW